ncbi:MAG: PQQ-dependent sugar dehydrogenase [Myxococcota bacterium]|nr:PQQ-dependent sugar dehydrogenase [Myxococcota bacterium]
MTNLASWALAWPGTPALVGLGLAAGLWRHSRPPAALLALATATGVVALAGRPVLPFALAVAGLLASALLLLAVFRGADQSRPRFATGAWLLVAALLLVRSWRAGALGLGSSGDGFLGRIAEGILWLDAWPGTGLVLAVSLLGLRGIAREGAGSRSFLPLLLVLAAAAALLALEGRSRILEAGCVSGLVVGVLLAALLGRQQGRGLVPVFLLSVTLLGWAFAVRGGQGSGSYVHPEGLPQEASLRVSVVDRGFALPSGLALAPDGRVFVAEFTSDTIWVLQEGRDGWSRELFARWPRSESTLATGRHSEAGLWGLALHPAGGWVYAMGVRGPAQSDGTAGEAEATSRVLRFRDVPGGEPPWETVREGLPAGRVHSGGALAFGPSGKLYLSVGDGGAENTGARPLAGTILRLEADGAIPVDNPDPDSPVFARGLRNPYGLAFSPAGRLYATENGPDCCDRLLEIRPGGDHGWPAYGGRPGDVVAMQSDPSVEAPLFDSGSSRIGPTGIAFVSEDSLLFATWHTAAVHRVQLGEAGAVVGHDIVLSAPLARAPSDSVYPYAGGFTALASDSQGRTWFATVDAVGHFR